MARRHGLAALLLGAILVSAELAGLLRAGGVAPAAAAGASDDRSLVSAAQLTERPFRGLALVIVDDRVVCTGFVIAPNKVATAAHCLARDASDGDFRLRRDLPGSVRVYRAYSRAVGSAPAGCGVTRAWAHPRFIRRDAADDSFASSAHDYAVLTVAPGCAISSRHVLRLWATEAGDGQLAAGASSRMAGYPSDRRFAGMSGLNLWRTRGRLWPVSNDDRLLDTTGFVAQGMSGSPVWRGFDGSSPCGRAHCVVGIVTECAVNSRGLCRQGDSLRRAVRITSIVRRTLLSH